MTITVLLVDDQTLMREGLRLILESADDVRVVGEASDGTEVDAMVAALDPDLVLMDIRMTTVDGIEATRRLITAGHRARVLILTTYDLDEHLYDAVHAGASGFLLKTAPPQQLLGTIRAAAAGDTVLAPELVRRLLERFVESRPSSARREPTWLRTLSTREHEVLLALAQGRTNDEIARALYLSAATVKSHVNSLFRKLHARDRVHAVILAYEAGLVRPGDHHVARPLGSRPLAD